MAGFKFYTEPFSHQESEFHNSKDKEAYGILWEQGTGKSKLLCDQVVHLWLKDKISGVLIVAPNGVHRSWVNDQIKTHVDPSLPIRTFIWNGSKSNTIKFKDDFDKFVNSPDHVLCIFLINYEAIRTKKGFYACDRFLKARKCLMACDEAHRIKTHDALQTKCATALGALAKYRRILTGTIVGNSAFDIYSQFKFLDPTILKQKSFFAFRNRYGIFVPVYIGKRKNKKGKVVDTWIKQLKTYNKLDELQRLIADHSSRVLKTDVLDLPERLYTKRYYEMGKEQTKLYNDLKKKFMVELESGEQLSAPLALVRLLRLQQILCGYLPIDGENVRIPDGETNPRIQCLKETLEDYENAKVIIWCRFIEDIKQVAGLLGKNYCTYFGETSDDDREEAVASFTTDPNCKYFISNAQCGGTGLNLQAASVVIYYSNSFNLIDRLQSEDRAHRIGQANKVTYVDIVCPNTVDERIIDALRGHQNIAQAINGDKLRNWI